MTDTTTEPTLERLQETYDTFSEELREFITERIDKTTLNWLCIYGVPQTPMEVKTLVSAVYRGISSLLILNDFAKLTKSGAGSIEDVEKFRAARKEAEEKAKGNITRLFDPGAFDQQFKMSGQGGYL